MNGVISAVHARVSRNVRPRIEVSTLEDTPYQFPPLYSVIATNTVFSTQQNDSPVVGSFIENNVLRKWNFDEILKMCLLSRVNCLLELRYDRCYSSDSAHVNGDKTKEFLILLNNFQSMP